MLHTACLRGNIVKVRTALRLAFGAALISTAAASIAQDPAGAGSGVAAASPVASFYNSFQSRPIWFRNGLADPATAQLVSILRRAPFDGLANGPALAAGVEAALAQARSGNPADIAAADRLLSTAWVEYA